MESQTSLRVLFLKSDDISPEVSASLAALSCQVARLQLLKFDYEPFQASLSQALGSLDAYSGLALNSVNSAIALHNLRAALPSAFEHLALNLELFVVGEKTAKYLSDQLGLKAALVGKNCEELFRLIDSHYPDGPRRVLYLVGTLSDLGQNEVRGAWAYDAVTVYRTMEADEGECAQQLEALLKTWGAAPDVLVYFSPSNLRFFMGLVEARGGVGLDLPAAKHVCFGEKTRKEMAAANARLGKQGRAIPEENIVLCGSSNAKEIPVLVERIRDKRL